MRPFVLAALCVLALPAAAQHAQPYAGLERRAVTGLSESEIADLRAGRGMGMALPAELNGYPGPMHVLELAEPLRLTPGQRAAVQAQFATMRAEAIPAGERLIAAESALDVLFRHRRANPEALGAAAEEAGAARAAVRQAHLRDHLMTADVLTPEQLARYASLRGYGAAAHRPGGHAPRH